MIVYILYVSNLDPNCDANSIYNISCLCLTYFSTRVQNKDHRGQGSFLRANIKLPSNCKGMKASQQFEKGIKAVCQHGKGIKASVFWRRNKT